MKLVNPNYKSFAEKFVDQYADKINEVMEPFVGKDLEYIEFTDIQNALPDGVVLTNDQLKQVVEHIGYEVVA